VTDFTSNFGLLHAYPSEKTSALTLVELERWLALTGRCVPPERACVAFETACGSLGGRSCRRRKTRRKPEDPQTFFLDFLPEEWRLIRREPVAKNITTS